MTIHIHHFETWLTLEVLTRKHIYEKNSDIKFHRRLKAPSKPEDLTLENQNVKFNLTGLVKLISKFETNIS